MTLCTIVLTVVTCTTEPGTAQAPRPTPAEAVAILSGSIAPAQVSPASDSWPGPRSESTGATGPSLGPWDWPEPAPARRLDGTLLSEPPAMYGAPPYILIGPDYVAGSDRRSAPAGRGRTGTPRRER